ncbi:DUF1631 family protein [Rhizobacter sp. Root404]|uniref:DUF1631 family protein n=1 Tax=Rhizobacter sp. Root404 TaxID=1736528 RepID=UPI0006FEE83C|nr:DUF1631 family protein [Rhizobacter sp. Root404]KQW34716.1 hypothetical protein ASC76_23495 [Rhizobacter sp. Root404]
MPTPANPTALAQQARRAYLESLIAGLPGLVQAVDQGSRVLLSQVAEPSVVMRRRELIPDFPKSAPLWLQGMSVMLGGARRSGLVSATHPGELPLSASRQAKLSLVDDDTIEHEIITSKLALAMMDRASWEFSDLRSRMNVLERREEMDTNDVIRPHVIARIATASWRSAGLGLDLWRLLQRLIHEEFTLFAEEAYHETNRFLLERHVLPDIDLRPFIRRSRNSAMTGFGAAAPAATGGGSGGFVASGGGEVNEETRMMTRAGGLSHAAGHAEQVLGRLNRLVARQLPGFGVTQQDRPVMTAPRLKTAINDAQQAVARRMATAEHAATIAGHVSTPALLEELNQRKQALKQAATTPVERATIEIVALLFQSILTEERIPPAVRVWFARLQMPVLRVAVSEPDFFATIDHPARRLIDRMGSCVMGFDANSRAVGDVIEKEIKRVVQVVEAYPDTGRRVFQTVLVEFEKFLEHYFKNENEASRKGVSLAQQVEQRETLAIQYTIELRKMLNEMPVQEGVREFLFHVWADVLAMAAVKHGNQSDATRDMKRAAADLIWSASAKVSREERAEVIRRLPPLLKTLRDGMDNAGVPVGKQDEHIQQLNNSLAAAFTAKTAAIPHERLEELMARLDTLEELLPEADDLEIDEAMVHDLSGHESSELEVVAEGGSMPTPAMVAWARELQVGSWYMLDYRNRNEPMQLAWQGMRRQLTLFVSPQGRGVLFQQNRLAAFLQAGLLVPAQDESLTVKATRSALAKIDGDPSRLLN